MGFRALSGILVVRDHPQGNATVHFHDHSVTGTVTRAHKTREVGGSGAFASVPCKMVALRELRFEVGHESDRFPRRYAFRIDETRVTRDYLEIEWRGGSSMGGIEEISYMVMGETAD